MLVTVDLKCSDNTLILSYSAVEKYFMSDESHNFGIYPQQELCRRYTDPKCVLALIFANALRSQNLQFYKTHNKFPLYGSG